MKPKPKGILLPPDTPKVYTSKNKMDITENINDLLESLGLAAQMSSDTMSPLYKDLTGRKDLARYKPIWYRENIALQDTDEFYRMTTLVYLHLPTGIRCEYHLHENYFGDYSYKLGDIFVITIADEKREVLDYDFKNKRVVTKNGEIEMDQLKLKIDETD